MTTPDRAAAADILRVTSLGGRLILVMFIAVDLALAVANIDEVVSPWSAILCVALITAAGVIVTRPTNGTLPMPRALLVLFITTVTSAVAAWNMPIEPTTSYATWHLGAITLVLLFLAMWGWLTLAWVGFGLMVVVTAAWTFTTAEGSVYVLALVPNQVGTLLVGTLFSIGLRATSRRIADLHAKQAVIAAAESATRAAAVERAAQAARLNQMARAALERIAEDEPYTDAERDSWMRLEATVRDSLRASALISDELTAATDDARERGIEVTLLDDSAGAVESGSEREKIIAAIITELAGMDSGRLIGRVLPAGRGQLATILVDEAGHSRHIDV
jgi:hypothetical protein